MALSLDGTTGISASGNITGGNVIASGALVVGSFSPLSLSTAGNVTGGNLLTSGLISSTGNITGGNISATNHTGTTVSVTGNITGGNISATNYTGTSVSVTGSVSGASASLSGNITVGNISVGSGVSTAGSYSATGNVTGGNINTGGIVSVAGNIVTGTNGSLGIGTTTPDAEVNILANPQTVSYPVTGNSTTSGTDLHISGANGQQTRITQDAFGTGSYVAFTGRAAGGTAASPTQTLTGDALAQFTARGFSNGSLQFGNTSTGYLSIVAAENFTDTSRATNVAIYTTASGAITPTAIATFSSALGLSIPSIVNSGANGVGNIGNSTTYFNTIFAKATSAQYADLAEMYCADSEYTPGTVLEFGGTDEVTITTQSHSTQIAGIVSTNPSYLMNSTLNCDNAVQVALVGRVPCSVVGTIAKGDRLVASTTPGIATRLDMSQYQPGCIVGKALEDYDSETAGIIEVAVGRI